MAGPAGMPWLHSMPWLSGSLQLGVGDLLFKMNFLRALADDLGSIPGLQVKYVVEDQRTHYIGSVRALRPGHVKLHLDIYDDGVLLDGFRTGQPRLYQKYELSNPTWLDLVMEFLQVK